MIPLLLTLLTCNHEYIESHDGTFDVGFVLIQLKEEVSSFEWFPSGLICGCEYRNE
jgi:hypothetical protein